LTDISGQGRAAHYPDLARDVVRRNPDLIIAITTALTLDFKAATTTIRALTQLVSPPGLVAAFLAAAPGID
jgi:hypothetical protein